MHFNNYIFFTYIDNTNLENITKFNKKVNIIFRNYKKRFKNQDLAKLVHFCKKNKRKIYLANDIKRAKILNFDGVYIPSFNKLSINYDKGIRDNFTILGSAHNMREVKIKKDKKIDIIFLSPLFKNNKNRDNLGIIKFNLLKQNFNNKFIALGGINNQNKCMLKLLNVNGFAAISYFNGKN